jgi:type II secretory pathway predicted ATPase ExeA/LysM repeat protein
MAAYYRHFGLSGSPFQFSATPRFIFPSKTHRLAMIVLEPELLRGGGGFSLITGDDGVGKTTLVLALFERIQNRLRAAYVGNPRLGFDGILREVMRQLGITARTRQLDPIGAVEYFAGRLKPADRTVIIIDDAQNLSDETLEELRQFSEHGHSLGRLVQFLLVGRSEMVDRLARSGPAVLGRCVVLHAALMPLTVTESKHYVARRLESYGRRARQVFQSRALTYVAKHSGGIPRRINVLCHNAMLTAFTQGLFRVDMNSARAAVDEYQHLYSPEQLLGPPKQILTDRGRIFSRHVRALIGCAALGASALAAYGAIHLRATSPVHHEELVTNDGPLPQAVAPNSMVTASEPRAIASPADRKRILKALGNAAGNFTVGTAVASGGSQISANRHAQVVHVRAGDTLESIAATYLGTGDALDQLIAANPQLTNLEHIYPGQVIFLPDSRLRR